MNRQKLKGNAMLLLTAMIWGMSFIAQSKGVEDISPVAFTGLRSILGSIVLIGKRKSTISLCRKSTEI